MGMHSPETVQQPLPRTMHVMRIPQSLKTWRVLSGLALFLVMGCTEPTGTPAPETPEPATPTPLLPDADQDGVPDATDCKPDDGTVYPGAQELCDGLDQDCDQVADNGALVAYFYDADQDGHGNPAVTVSACSAPVGYVEPGDDCNDSDPRIYGGAPDICDTLDNDCDTQVDEDIFTFYQDQDRDGHGTSVTGEFCSEAAALEAGYATLSDDCQDLDSSVFPGAPELCDTKDNDCDTQVDEDNQVAWYPDTDKDGYGQNVEPTMSCSKPEGTSNQNGDCDDTQAAINPKAVEACNGVDDNCNSEVDEEGARGEIRYFRDQDQDGFGTSAQSLGSCSSTAPVGYVANDDDCNDLDAAVYPGAAETCNSKDDNCDGIVPGSETQDLDADGIVTCAETLVYSMTFDTGLGDWQERELSGSARWYSSKGMLCENDGSAAGYAYSPELGALTQYTIEADVLAMGTGNDTVGLIFSFVGDSFYALLWQDPTNYYKDYSPAGELELWSCSWNGYYHTCNKLASDPDTGPLTMAADSIGRMGMKVSDKTAEFYFNGSLLYTVTANISQSFSLGRIGVYSDNSDGGVCYDNVVVY